MPTMKKKFQTAEAPPIDWLWAAVLERQRVYGLSLEEMAKIAGVSYPVMRRYVNQSPWSWSRNARDKICSKFGININVAPTENQNVEVRLSS